MSVTVAIPVLNGGAFFARTLAAVRSQSIEAELLVCDSGSSDGSRERAVEAGARVIDLQRFAHGPARNLLMHAARTEYVALLTQDAEPATNVWLERLLDAFAEGVALAYGPYRPRPNASPVVRRELEQWFDSIEPGVEALGPEERALPHVALMGRRGFFTDANACIDRAAWKRVPFRDVAYAEDRALALDMLRAGYGKVYVPEAAVLHSHDYAPLDYFRRCFDEWRGLNEVYGWVEPLSPRHILRQLRGEVGLLNREQTCGAPTLAATARHHLLRLTGAVLGSRADRLPAPIERWCSLERRIT